MVIKSLYSRVCFLTYILYGKPCVQSDCSRLLVCACVHVFIPGAALRFCRVMCCSIFLVRVARISFINNNALSDENLMMAGIGRNM